MKNKLLLLILALLLIIPSVTVFADGDEGEVVVIENKKEEKEDNKELLNSNEVLNRAGVKEVDSKKVGEKLEKKAWSVVEIMQKVLAPICIVGMLAGIFVIIFGGRKRNVGVVMMAFSILGYGICYYAPELASVGVSFFSDIFS